MEDRQTPPWITVLAEDDLQFLKQFLLASGSLKQLAGVYGVSYPTIRARLDRLIERVKAVEAPASGDSFERLVDTLVDRGIMVSGTGRTLVQTHKRILRETTGRVARDVSPVPPEGEWTV